MKELADIQLYDLKDIAELLGISTYTANKYCREKQIKAIKVGREWRVTKESLDKFLKR